MRYFLFLDIFTYGVGGAAVIILCARVIQSLRYARLRERDPVAAEAMRQDLVRRWAKVDRHPVWWIAFVAFLVGY